MKENSSHSFQPDADEAGQPVATEFELTEFITLYSGGLARAEQKVREHWRSATPDFDGQTGHYVGMLGKLPVYQTDTGRNFVSIKGKMFQVPDSEVKKD